MLDFWNKLKSTVINNSASKDEIHLYNLLYKAFTLLSQNPKYPSLNTHEISELTSRYGLKVFESYLENNTPAARRIFWVYGPNKQDITIVAIEPHPNDKNNAYKKIKLSSLN